MSMSRKYRREHEHTNGEIEPTEINLLIKLIELNLK